MTDESFLIGVDHVVLTVRDIEATCRWYERALGMRRTTFDRDLVALHFGVQKINLHPAQMPHSPHAKIAAPGTADLCFTTSRSIDEITKALAREAVRVELGPVRQTGARGLMQSVYIRDPDDNLIEIATYE